MMEKKEKGRLPRVPLLLVLGTALGIALLWLGSSGRSQAQASSPAVPAEDAFLTYADRTKAEIKTACEAVRGVSGVTVLLSFESDFENVYACDSDTTGRDGTTQTTDKYLTVGSGAGEAPVLITKKPPRIAGIGIVCRGGGNAAVRQELTSLLSSAFGVGANKISVVEAKSSD